MAVSDAQYEAWLADDSKVRVFLAELTYVIPGGDGTEFTKRVSNVPFIAYVGSPAAIVPYDDDRIVGVPGLSVSLPEDLMGASTVAWSDLELDNMDGELDEWLEFAFNGRLAQIFIGDPTWDIGDFRRVFNGVIEEAYAKSEALLAIKLRSNMWYLNKEIDTGKVGGSGQFAEEPNPLILGKPFNAEPILINATTRTYKVGVPPIHGVAGVSDNGVPLQAGPVTVTVDAATNVFTRVAHGFVAGTRLFFDNTTGTNISEWDAASPGVVQYYERGAVAYYVIASGLTADNFKISATLGGAEFNVTGTAGGLFRVEFALGWSEDYTNGTISLAAAPAGRITCIVYGLLSDDSPTEWMHSPLQILDYLARNYTDLPADAIDSSYLRNFSDFHYPVSDTIPAAASDIWLGLRLTGRENLLEVFDKIVRSLFGYFTFDRDGVLRLGRIVSPDVADDTNDDTLPTPDLFLTEDDVDLGSELVQVRRELPLASLEIHYSWNFTPMVDSIASSVSGFSREVLAREYTTLQIDGVGIENGYPLAPHAAIDTYALGFSYLSQWTQTHLDLRSRVRTTHRLESNASGLTIDIGSFVNLTHPRYGFDAGAGTVVVGMSEDLLRSKVTLDLWK